MNTGEGSRDAGAKSINPILSREVILALNFAFYLTQIIINQDYLYTFLKFIDLIIFTCFQDSHIFISYVCKFFSPHMYACMYVHHVHDRCLWGPEEGIGLSDTRLQTVVSCHVSFEAANGVNQ